MVLQVEVIDQFSSGGAGIHRNGKKINKQKQNKKAGSTYVLTSSLISSPSQHCSKTK